MTKLSAILILAGALSSQVYASDFKEEEQAIKQQQQQLEAEQQKTEHLKQQHALQKQIADQQNEQRKIQSGEQTVEAEKDNSAKGGFVQGRDKVTKEAGRVVDQVSNLFK